MGCQQQVLTVTPVAAAGTVDAGSVSTTALSGRGLAGVFVNEHCQCKNVSGTEKAVTESWQGLTAQHVVGLLAAQLKDRPKIISPDTDLG